MLRPVQKGRSSARRVFYHTVSGGCDGAHSEARRSVRTAALLLAADAAVQRMRGR